MGSEMCIRDSFLKGLHKSGLRRSIKYDDTEMTLALDVCLPDSNDWFRVTYKEAVHEYKERIETGKRGRGEPATTQQHYSDASASTGGAGTSRGGNAAFSRGGEDREASSL